MKRKQLTSSTKYTHLFFDLDGTLIDSKPGIFNSVYFTLNKMEIPESEWPEDLNSFIGPPLRESFKSLFGLNAKEAENATKICRDYYGKKGLNEFEFYQGIPEVLTVLREAGYSLSLVTSKAEIYAIKIIENAGIKDLFTTISGCEISGIRSEKAELINYTLEKLGLQPSKQILMIGDRYHDLKGARLTGISSAAVLYGYGSAGELEAEKPCLTITTPFELAEKIIGSVR